MFWGKKCLVLTGLLLLALFASNIILLSMLRQKNIEITRINRNTQLAKCFEPLNLLYTEYPFKRRLVINDTVMLSLPSDGAEVFRPIMANTVIEVEDAVVANGDKKWLFVYVHPYDTPVNMKGWIKESETTAYTRESQSQVLADLTVKANTMIYESSDGFGLDTALNIPAKRLGYDTIGRIIKRDRGYLLLTCPGGESFWVKEKYALYPPVD